MYTCFQGNRKVDLGVVLLDSSSDLSDKHNQNKIRKISEVLHVEDGEMQMEDTKTLHSSGKRLKTRSRTKGGAHHEFAGCTTKLLRSLEVAEEGREKRHIEGASLTQKLLDFQEHALEKKMDFEHQALTKRMEMERESTMRLSNSACQCHQQHCYGNLQLKHLIITSDWLLQQFCLEAYEFFFVFMADRYLLRIHIYGWQLPIGGNTIF